MQVSNSSLSQFISSSVNFNQNGKRPSVKPITIEGQLVDDEKNKTAEKQSTVSVSERTGSESQTQLIQPPATPVQSSGDFNNALLSQKTSQNILQQSPDNKPAPSLVSQNDLSQNGAASINPSSSPNFPYANRRSFEGIAGSSLVIQTYLNNESPTQNQPAQVQGNINFFV